MRNLLIQLPATILVAWCGLAPLSAQPASNLAGTWHAREAGFTRVLVLNADGTGTFDDEPIRYSVKGTTLSVNDSGEISDYSFALNGNSLRLSGGDLDAPMVFERQGAAPATGLGARREAAAAKAAGGGPAGGAAGLVGRWQGPQGVTQINDNGTMMIGGEMFRYSVAGNIITITGSDGSVPLPFDLRGDTLAVTINGQTQTLTRVKGGAAPAGGGAAAVRQEMVGKWCYFANVTASAGGGRMSQECFTLNGDGTYQYASESSASAYSPGIVGMTSAQGADSGTWSATDSTITARSQSGQLNTYALEKRNNRNNDPMLCLDGRCYATAFQKAPWR
jgi:hypothetical protein